MEMFPEVAGDEEQHEEAQQHRHPHAGDLQRVDRVVIPREQVDVGEGVLGRGGGRGQLALLTNNSYKVRYVANLANLLLESPSKAAVVPATFHQL